ncbi:MAG: PilN domain-containing protein [Gemmatimonadaceae bacterium]
MRCIGLELTATHVRAVRRSWRGAVATLEIAWDADDPDGAAATLRAKLGTASSVRLAIGSLLLRVKEVLLPDVAPAEQWRAIALQPARYFAELGSSVTSAVSWHRAAQLAFAIDAERVDRWVGAFSTLGPVTLIVPAPVALQFTGLADGTYEISAAGDAIATASLAGGRLTHARVARRAQSNPAREIPPAGALGAEWTVAIGAAAARGVDDWESLTTAASQRGLRTRRVRGVAMHTAAMIVALIGALAALDYSRSTYEARLDRAIVAAEGGAQPGLALRRRLAGLDREAQLLRASVPGSNDAVHTLAALSELLPRSVVVTRLRMTADAWQASGRARGGEAAAIVPALERDPRFTDVRMTSPSTRFREDAQEFESFSVAFRVRPTD